MKVNVNKGGGMLKEKVSKEEAAKMLSVSERTIERYVQTGALKDHKVLNGSSCWESSFMTEDVSKLVESMEENRDALRHDKKVSRLRDDIEKRVGRVGEQQIDNHLSMFMSQQLSITLKAHLRSELWSTRKTALILFLLLFFAISAYLNFYLIQKHYLPLLTKKTKFSTMLKIPTGLEIPISFTFGER